MKECLIRNLAYGPRDYPMADGSSIYLGSKGCAESIARIPAENISEAMRIAEGKSLIAVEEANDGDDYGYHEQEAE